MISMFDYSNIDAVASKTENQSTKFFPAGETLADLINSRLFERFTMPSTGQIIRPIKKMASNLLSKTVFPSKEKFEA